MFSIIFDKQISWSQTLESYADYNTLLQIISNFLSFKVAPLLKLSVFSNV